MSQNVVSEAAGSELVANGELAATSTESNSSTSSAGASHSKANQSNGRTGARSGPHASTALQDMFLNGLRRENIDVVVYFSDGTQERGVVRAFDTFTLLLENRGSGKAQLVYKHAVARIFPVRTPALALDRAAKKQDA